MNAKMILATATLTTSLLFPNAVYPATGVVTNVTENEIVSVERTDGHVYEFQDTEFPWWDGDICTLLMSDNGTPEPEDDKILCHIFSGTVMDMIDIYANSMEKGNE